MTAKSIYYKYKMNVPHYKKQKKDSITQIYE